jgi:hypothetical protein
MGPDRYVEDQASMSRIAVNFYKNLFAAEEIDDISMWHDFWEEGDLVTQEERDLLDAPFSEEEIKEVVFSSYSM